MNSNTLSSVRNGSLDVLKWICALLVVFIHCNYPYKEEILPLSDIAVPLFFCISGYLIFGTKRKWSRVRRIAKILAWSALLYLAKTELFQLLMYNHPFIPSFKDWGVALLFNDVAFAIHLWYLPAYLYVLVFAFLIDKYGLWHKSFHLIIPLIIVGSLVKRYVCEYCPQEIYLFRNAYFVGIPYFLLGAFIKNYPPPETSINSSFRKEIVGNPICAVALDKI